MIDLQKIETFLFAAESLNLTRTAKQLHLSQLNYGSMREFYKVNFVTMSFCVFYIWL